MNAVFQAPDFPAVNWKDARFMPKSILEAVLFPFYFSLDGRTNDLPFRDVRFAIVYVLLVVACLRWIYQRACGVKSREKTDIAVLWLLVFFVVSYVIWQLQFSIMRYAMPLEMLAPLVIFLLLNTMMQDKLVLAGSVFAAYAFILIAISPAPAVRAPWYAGNYFNVQLPLAAERQEPAMVLLPVSAYAFNLKPRPQTYLIGSLPPSWRYIGVAFNGEKITVGVRAPEVIKHFNGRLFLLASGEFLPQMYQAAASLGLSAAGACDDIKSDRQKITYEDVKLCPLKK
jgi:hypothetical protein